MNTPSKSYRVLAWMGSFLTVGIILMLSVRVLITPLFARIEYRLPNFPNDPYGFTMEDRLRWSEPAITYLINNQGIGFLEALTFDDGSAVFTARELSHMQDVKTVVSGMRIALVIAILLLLGITYLAVKQGWRDAMIQALKRGAWGVIGLIGVILFLLLVNFNQLFVWFHMLFFESGTWMFYTYDTLIRLFPMRFWQDAFIYVGVLSLLMAVGVIGFAKQQGR